MIKEGTYGDTKDREGRDIKDRLMWQKQLHQQLQGKVRVPRYIGSFEEGGNYYLVLEQIPGKSLYKACREKHNEIREGLISGNKLGLAFLGYLIQITTLLEIMHNNQIIHRDVSANNFIITPSGKVTIIDMELSYSLKQELPSPPFQLGTFGYMSPQQEKKFIPSVKDDIFSLGAIILQVWTGISPMKIINTPLEELTKKIQFFIPDQANADIVTKCLDVEPSKRPTLIEIRQVIFNYKSDIQLRKKRLSSKPFFYTKENITHTIQSAIGTLASPLLNDLEKGWFSEDRRKELLEDKKKINKAWYTSFNKGAAGIIYMLAKAKQVGFDTSACDSPIQKALHLIELKYINRIKKVSASFHYGSTGIAASLITAIKEKLFEPLPIHFDWITQLITVDDEKDTDKMKGINYVNGKAGQGIAHWHYSAFLSDNYLQKRLDNYLGIILDTQEQNGSWLNTEKEGNKAPLIGFAYGIAGIVYFILNYVKYKKEKGALLSAQRGLEWLMQKSPFKSKRINWFSPNREKNNSFWSDGPAGISLTFLKAYEVLGDSKYKKYAIDTLNSIPHYMFSNSLSQFNGLSGLGEIYLEAHNVTRDPIWLDRACWIAQIVMHLKKDDKAHGPYWLVEHEKHPTSDFMNGNSGLLHFLLRYCYPNQISYPLLGNY